MSPGTKKMSDYLALLLVSSFEGLIAHNEADREGEMGWHTWGAVWQIQPASVSIQVSN